jgi:hypothetical protein
MSITDPDIIALLGQELIRIGSSLRLHPDNPGIALDLKDQLPLLIAALNLHKPTASPHIIPGASVEEYRRGPNDGSIIQHDFTITSVPI